MEVTDPIAYFRRRPAPSPRFKLTIPTRPLVSQPIPQGNLRKVDKILPNGSRIEYQMYDNRVLHGIYKKYYPNGNLLMSIEFENGYPVTDQIKYFPNGTILSISGLDKDYQAIAMEGGNILKFTGENQYFTEQGKEFTPI